MAKSNSVQSSLRSQPDVGGSAGSSDVVEDLIVLLCHHLISLPLELADSPDLLSVNVIILVVVAERGHHLSLFEPKLHGLIVVLLSAQVAEDH
eukprot:1310124-Amphidinium_carterae.1